MSDLTLTKIRFVESTWEGRISGAGATGQRPDVKVRHLDQPVEGVELSEAGAPGEWTLKITVPRHAIADGVQTFLISDAGDGSVLGHFTLIAGDAMADDLRAEVDLLRAELDMLKRAFRRHCLETT